MLEWLWGQKSGDIAAVKYYEKSSSPWGEEAVLFFVKNGLGRLRTAYGVAKDRTWKSFLLLNGVPLVKWHSQDENDCPTCEKLISAGYGLEHVDQDTIQTIRNHTNQPYEGIEKAFVEFNPLLSLLPEGYYVLADLALFPTDGGRFFWNQSNTPRANKASCAIGYLFRWVRSWPSYLLPTQLPNRYDKVTVDSYREQYRSGCGDRLRGVAFHMDAYLCVLLDGHHKAIAAAQEGCEFRCLTILPVTGYSYSPSANEKKVWFGGVELCIEDLDKNLNQKKYLQSKSISITEIESLLAMEASCWDEAVWPDEVTEIEKRYPDVLGLACTKLAGDISDERIERLLHGGENEWEEELNILLRALIASKDIRTKKLALTIGRNEGLKELWYVAFKYLATIPGDDIEQFFINFLIDDDKRHPYLTKIADDYLIKV